MRDIIDWVHSRELRLGLKVPSESNAWLMAMKAFVEHGDYGWGYPSEMNVQLVETVGKYTVGEGTVWYYRFQLI